MRIPAPIAAGQPGPLIQPLFGGLTLRRGAVHLASGRARHAFAALLMARTEGAVLWITAAPAGDRLHPGGLQAFADPGRLILAEAAGIDKMVECVDAALRSGAVPLVVADLPTAPGPDAIPSLDRAAVAGIAAAQGLRPAPLGLLLVSDDAGIGAESRWHMTPIASTGPDMNLAVSAAPGLLRWRLDRARDGDRPAATWQIVLATQGQATLTPL